MWKIRDKDRDILYKIYKETKEHKKTHSKEKVMYFLEKWLTIKEIAEKNFSFNYIKPLTKEEFYRIDNLYKNWCKEPRTIKSFSWIDIYRIKRYYFYNLK